MDVTILILQILTVLGALYLISIKSYFQEKGKNLATKQDIGEITNRVEKIKNELTILSQHKLNLTFEEKNSLVNCYENYRYWQTTVLNVYLTEISEENLTRLDDMKNKMNEAQFHFEISLAKVELFTTQEIIIQNFHKIKIETMHLQHHTEGIIDKLQYLIKEFSLNKKQLETNQYISAYKEFLDKKTPLLDDLRKQKVDLLKDKIAPIQKVLLVDISKQIRSPEELKN